MREGAAVTRLVCAECAAELDPAERAVIANQKAAFRVRTYAERGHAAGRLSDDERDAVLACAAALEMGVA